MKLVFTPSVNYIHKTLVVAHESGVLDSMQFERCSPFDDDTTIWQFNPLGKVPTLVLDNGESLYGGLVICEYLDSLSPGKRLIPTGEARWQALRQFSLGDGLFDTTTILRVESYRPEAERRPRTILRERNKVMGILQQLERDAAGWKADVFHLGHVGAAGGLSWLSWKCPINTLNTVAGDDRFDWRQHASKLATWYDKAIERPSLAFKLDPERIKGKAGQPPSATAGRA